MHGRWSVLVELWNVDDEARLKIPDLGPVTSKTFTDRVLVNPSLGFMKFAGLSVKLPVERSLSEHSR